MKQLLLLTVLLFGLHAESISELKKACDLNDGHAHACSRLGDIYKNGHQGVKQDDIKATIYYIKACNGGHAFACRLLGDIYGAKQDDIKATKYYIKALNGGHGHYARDELGVKRYLYDKKLIYTYIVVFIVFVALIGMFKRIFSSSFITVIVIWSWLLHVMMFPDDHNLIFMEIFYGGFIIVFLMVFTSLMDIFLLLKDRYKDKDND